MQLGSLATLVATQLGVRVLLATLKFDLVRKISDARVALQLVYCYVVIEKQSSLCLQALIALQLGRCDNKLRDDFLNSIFI